MEYIFLFGFLLVGSVLVTFSWQIAEILGVSGWIGVACMVAIVILGIKLYQQHSKRRDRKNLQAFEAGIEKRLQDLVILESLFNESNVALALLGLSPEEQDERQASIETLEKRITDARILMYAARHEASRSSVTRDDLAMVDKELPEMKESAMILLGISELLMPPSR